MSTLRGDLAGIADRPCAACPWRVSNHGRRTADGWYTKANLRRLWSGLRTGNAPGMSCHPTDPDNPAPSDRPGAAAPSGADFLECAGAHVLLQRELRLYESACAESDQTGEPSWSLYRQRSQSPTMTREGLAEYVARIAFGGSPLDPRPVPQDLTRFDSEVGR